MDGAYTAVGNVSMPSESQIHKHTFEQDSEAASTRPDINYLKYIRFNLFFAAFSFVSSEELQKTQSL